MKRATLFAFLIIAFVDLVALQWGWEAVHLAAKPLIIVLLGIHYAVSSQESNTNSHRWTWAALGFSWAGDVLLLNQDDTRFFMLGLASFLLAHIFYIISYRHHRHAGKSGLLFVQRVRFSLPVFLAGTGLIVVLYPGLGELKWPVIFYAVVLMVMVAEAIFRYGQTTAKSFWLVFGGAMLFMVSDSLIAINKFYVAFPRASLWIMVTYILAQLLIITGLLEHKKATSI